MNIKAIVISFVSLLVLFSLGGYGYVQYNKWNEVQTEKVPEPDTPERAMYDYIKYDALIRHRRLKRFTGTRCLQIPSSYTDAKLGKFKNPLTWRLDFLNPQPDVRKKEDMAKLDSYVAVGLLEKTNTTALIKGKQQAVSRYQLTDKGWKASGYRRQKSCFFVGDIGYQNVKNMEIDNKFPKQKIYKITAHFALDPNLPNWAKSSEIMNIKGIQKDLTGSDHDFLFIKIDGDWYRIEDADSLDKIEVDFQGKWQDYHTVRSILEQQPASQKPVYPDELQQKIDQVKNAKPVTKDEISNYIKDKYEKDSTGDNWPHFCMSLPGSSKIPVDKELGHEDYSIAIFKDKSLRKHKVTEKTLPYIKKLESLGVLKYTGEQLIEKHKKGGSDNYLTDTYTLSDEYTSHLIPRLDCLSLGKTTADIIDVQIYKKERFGIQLTSYKYKMKLLKKTPSTWATDPKLAKWTELQNTLKYGVACQGEFEYDLIERGQGGGGGSCWPAFDSIEYR